MSEKPDDHNSEGEDHLSGTERDADGKKTSRSKRVKLDQKNVIAQLKERMEAFHNDVRAHPLRACFV